ncbi:MAG: nucleotide sugar dehydrogenase [Candidatus Buchananbacteria bacterium]
MNKRIKPILVNPQKTIRQVMVIIDKAPKQNPPAPAGLILVVDKNNTLLGIATDGDIRRAVIKNINLNLPISEIMNKDPFVVENKFSRTEVLSQIYEEIKRRNIVSKRIDKIIIVNAKKQVEDVVSFFEVWKNSEIKVKEICVVGLGYVGLTLALTYADAGFYVVGIESQKEVFDLLTKGQPHFHEVGIDSLLKYHLNKNFVVRNKLTTAPSDVYFLCVGTPVEKNKKPNLAYLKKATEQIGGVLKEGDLVVLRSTVPLGSTRNFVIPILEKLSGLKAGKDFHVAFAPERTAEGKALEELKTLPQIIGGIDKVSAEMAGNLFSLLTSTIVMVDSLEAAELVKLINNTYRDITFGFANELALVCDKLKLDTVKVIEAANKGYERSNVPLPSPGVGGACLVKDPYIFIDSLKPYGYQMKFPALGRQINEQMPKFVADKVFSFLAKNKIDEQKAKIFIVGFAFKGQPETSDIRNSTTLDLLDLLKPKLKNIYGFDPVAQSKDVRLYGVKTVDPADGFDQADCVIIMNNHDSYENWPIYKYLKKTNKPALFLDTWHLFSKEVVEKIKGITYDGLGID